ncbi:HAD family hydrolase [Streptomyces sulfonofaciens]|nr:HAD family hydrolase [Streptomyces sulfonofaciens]
MSGYRRLLACDLDGTLLTSAGELTGTVSAALHRAAAAGIAVAVITARPRRDVPPDVLARVPASAHWAHSNGALLFRPASPVPVRLGGFAPRQAARLMAAVREAGPAWSFALDLTGRTVLVDPFPVAEARYWNDVAVCDWPAVAALGEPVSKILVRTGTACDAALVSGLQRAVGDRAVATASGGRFAELGPRGATKQDALARICAGLGLKPRDAVAVGDGLNDLAMLSAAGTAAAPANAPEEVRRAADLVLPSNDDDAVAALVDLLLTGPDPDGHAPGTEHPVTRG